MTDHQDINEADVNKDAVAPFLVTKEGIDYFVQKYLNRKFTEEIDYIEKLGGPQFYEKGLCTSFDKGLTESDEEKDARISNFDSNERPPEEPIKFCDFVLEALEDKIIIILIFAAIVELVIGMVFGDHPSLDWIEGVCIIITIFIVVSVGAINNYKKEIEFRKQKESDQKKREVYVRKQGEWKKISEEEILVGDILKIESGMTIPCDCLLIEGSAELDESAMTGEIDPLMKINFDAALDKKKEIIIKHEKKGSTNLSHHEVESPIILSGTQVNQGDAAALILAVGNNSENGKIRATIDSNKSNEEGTPLEQKLSILADKIGWGGLIAAVLTSVGMALNLGIRVGIGKLDFEDGDAKTVINIFIIGIIVLVVAIPEGLPLAVTMTLAFSIGEMLKDQNFVRRMESCETMGNAEYICTDKTGTLTKNEMLVTKYYNFTHDKDLSETVSNDYKGDPLNFFNEKEWNLFKLSLACNTNTTFDEKGVEKGNKSDESLTQLIAKFGGNVQEIRKEYIKNIQGEKPQINFTSSRKKMSTIISHSSFPTGYRLLTKGASEIIINSCSHYLDGEGNVKPLSEKSYETIQDKIKEYALETLRTFCISYKDLTEEELPTFFEEYVNEKGIKIRPIEQSGLTLCGLIGIKDHMKDKVPESISNCHKAGIVVIMVTGDNIDTAYAIAKSCNIATRKDQTMLGDMFMEKIGGVICENCNKEYLGICEDKDGNNNKVIDNNKNLKEILKDCKCPRSKDEWIIKWKQERRQKDSKENPENHKSIINDPEKKKEYEQELDESAFKAFEDEGVKVKKDVIANIESFKEIITNLRVVARSQPQHKYALVTGLKQIEHVVAVTGDGTNDAPALSKADVGFAMHAGTDIAREASDIVIMNNEFKSIVNAIMWGRNVFDNIRRFIQFQLTVNFSACILVMIGASVGQDSPLTAIQMLWVNMIMDSLGSLALAAEKPTEELLDRPPIKRTDFIINRKMMKHILGQSIYQLIVLFVLLFSAPHWLPEYKNTWKQISYQLKYCFPEAPIYYKDEFKPENMYVMMGMETFFSNSTNLTYPDFSICSISKNEYFGDKGKSLKEAYNNIITEEYATPHLTIIFNTFVLMQLFHEICCRIIDDSFNIFKRIETNYMFLFIWGIEMGLQVLIICVTGPVFSVTKGGISPEHWGICIAFAAITFPVNFILKLLPDPCVKQESQELENHPLGDKGIISQVRHSSKLRKAER